MKRNRTKSLESVLLHSLKKQNFCDNDQTFRNNFVFEENITEMTQRLFKQVSSGSQSLVELMSFSLSEYSEAFEALRAYLQAINPPSTSGLKDLCLLTFVHIYLELVCAGRVEEALSFFSSYSSTNLIAQEKNWLASLKDIQSTESLNKNPAFHKIFNNFFEIKLNNAEQKSITLLIQTQKNSVLPKILNTKLKIVSSEKDVVNVESSAKNIAKNLTKTKKETTLTERKEIYNEPMILISPTTVSGLPSTPTKSEINQLSKITSNSIRETINNLRKSPPCPPNVCMFHLGNDNEGLTHGTLSNKHGLLCTGFESSSVKLWNLELNYCDDSKMEQKKKEINLHSIFSKNKTKKTVNVSHVNFFGDEFNEQYNKRNKNIKCTELEGHSDVVTASCFLQDDSHILTSSMDSTVRLWSTKDCINTALYKGHNWPVSCVVTSSPNFFFATSSFDKTAKLWSIDRTYPLRMFAGHEKAVNCVSFHPNASYLASACSSIRLWDNNSSKNVRLFNGHWDDVLVIKFSNNGKWLATGGADSLVIIWDIGSGVKFKELRGHTDSVYSLDFSFDDSMLISCGADGILFIWDLTCKSPQDSSHIVMNHKLSSGKNRLLMSKFVSNNIVYSLEAS